MSVRQLQEHLGIRSYRAAWYLCRIRKAMGTGHRTLPKMRGILEMDETYVGGKAIRCGKGRGRSSQGKHIVVALRQGNGRSAVQA